MFCITVFMLLYVYYALNSYTIFYVYFMILFLCYLYYCVFYYIIR